MTSIAEQIPVRLTIKQAAKRLGKSRDTLARWRSNNEGPRYLQFGRTILYPLDELQMWEAQQLRSGTAQ